MAYDKSINAGDVAGKLLDALRQDKKNIEMDAVIKAEIDQPSFNRAKKQIEELDKKDSKVTINTTKAEKTLNNLLDSLNEVQSKIKSISSSGVDFQGVYALTKTYENLKQKIYETAQAVDKSNEAFKKSQKIIRDTDSMLRKFNVTQDNTTKTKSSGSKKKKKTTDSTTDDVIVTSYNEQADQVKKITEATVEQNKAAKTKVDTQKQINAELQKEEEILKGIEAQEKKNVDIKNEGVKITEGQIDAQNRLQQAEKETRQEIKKTAEVIKSINNGRPLKIFDISNMSAKTKRSELKKIREFAEARWKYANGLAKSDVTGNATFLKKDGSYFDIDDSREMTSRLSKMSKSAFNKMMTNIVYAIFEDDERQEFDGTTIPRKLFDTHVGNLTGYIAKDNELYVESRKYVAAYREEVMKLYGALNYKGDARHRLSQEELIKYEDLATNLDAIKQYYAERERIEREAYKKQREYKELQDPYDTWESGPENGQETFFETDTDREIKLLEARIEYHKRRKQLIQETVDLAEEYKKLPLQNVSTDNLLIDTSGVDEEQGYIEYYVEKLDNIKLQLIEAIDSYDVIVDTLKEYVSLRRKVAELYKAGSDTNEHQVQLKFLQTQLVAGISDSTDKHSILNDLTFAHLPDFKFDDVANRIAEKLNVKGAPAMSQEAVVTGQKQLTEAVEETAEARKEEAKVIEEATKSKVKYYEIDEKAAKIAKENRSHWGYEEGSATASYRVAIDELAAVVEEKKKQFPDKAEQLDQLMDRFAKNLAQYINRDNQIGARYPSVMVAGPANYNIKKHDKQMVSWGKNYEFYNEKVAAIEKKIRNFGSAGANVIRGDEEDSLERLEARVEYMKYWHEVMVEANKFYRKNKTLEGFMGAEPDELEKIKKILADVKQYSKYDIPFPPYALENDGKNIGRLEGRIAELKRLQKNSLFEENEFYKLWEGKDSKDKMRIRIEFTMDRIDQEIFDLLKKNAFHKTKEGIYQRQITDNARYAAKKIQSKLHEYYGIPDVSTVQKTTEVIEAQTQATEKLAEARLKLTPKKEGNYTIPETYTALDGKYEISNGKDGWEVLQRDNAGLYNLIGTYKHLDDVRNDSSLLAREEITYTDEVIQEIKSLQEAYSALDDKVKGHIPVVNKYHETLDAVKSGTMSAADAIKLLNQSVPGYKEKMQEQMSNTTKLIGDLTERYGADKFSEIFGGTIDSFGSVNINNAKELYDALIAKDKEYLNTVSARMSAMGEFTKQNSELIGQFSNTDNWSAVETKVGEICAAMLEIGLPLEDANNQLKEFVKTLDIAVEKSSGIDSPLGHLVNSLNKLDSISPDPLNKIVESIVAGEAKISSEVQEILKSIGLLNDAGEFIGNYIDEGQNNSGVITNDKYAIIARTQEHYDEPESYDYDFKEGTTYIDNLIDKEKEAAEQGVNLARVLQRVKSEAANGSDLFYEIQELGPGKQLHTFDESKKNLQDFEKECEVIANASVEHIHKLMSDIIKLNELGFTIDFSPENVLYNTAKGFTLIDLAIRDLGLEAQTTTELMEGLITCLVGLENNEDRIKFGAEGAEKWLTAMLSVHNRLGVAFGKNNFGVNMGGIASGFSEKFTRYIGKPDKTNTGIDAEAPKAIDDTTKQVEEQTEANNKLITSYKQLISAVEEYVDLAKQRKPISTPEYQSAQDAMSSVRVWVDDDIAAMIGAAYKTVNNIKAAQKAKVSTYVGVNDDGSTYESNLQFNTLQKAEENLRGYIYHLVDDCGEIIEDVTKHFSGKRLRSFVEKEAKKYIEILGADADYRVQAEAFNEPIEKITEQICTNIMSVIPDANKSDAQDVLDELFYRANRVSRYTLSSQTNRLGSYMGVKTPYDEIEENAKKIESYDELYDAIKRYNELVVDSRSSGKYNIIYGGDKDPGFDEQDEKEYWELLSRFKKTGISDVYSQVAFINSTKDIEKLANTLGIAIPGAVDEAVVKTEEQADVEQKVLDTESKLTPAIKANTAEKQEQVEQAEVQLEAEQKINETLEERQDISKMTFGSAGETFTGTTPINFKYAVMSVEDLVMSHDAYGSVNPNYPDELQPRDRTRIASRAQVLKMAKDIIPSLLTASSTAQNGSPIVSKDGVVVGGNARSAALHEAYKNGHADGYKSYITEHASEFGLNPNNMPKNPVLVRVVDIDDGLDALAKQLNESTTAGYSASEQALVNEELIMKVISKLNIDESANLNAEANKDFINSFVGMLSEGQKSEMVTKDGSLSSVGLVKVKQALTGAAYGSKEILENLEQISPELVNISNALVASAAKAADIRYSIENGMLKDLGVVSTVLKGVDLLKTSRRKGYDIEGFLNQSSLFGEEYAAEDVAIGKFLEANVKNSAQLKSMIDIIFDFAKEAGDPRQISLDGIEDLTLTDVIKTAFAKYAERYQKTINYDALTDGYLPADISSRSDKRIDRADSANDVARSIEEATEKEKEFASAVDDSTKKIKTKNRFNKLSNEAMGDNEDLKEVILDKASDSTRMIELLSSAAGKSAATKFLEGITDETDLKSRITGFFKEVFGGDDWKFKEGKKSWTIKGNTYVAHLVNDAQDALHAVFQLNDGVLELQHDLVGFDGANIVDKFNPENAQKLALSSIDKIRADADRAKYDLTALEQQAKEIASTGDVVDFNAELKVATNNLQAIKNTTATKGSMNPLINMQRDMQVANTEIDTMELKLDKLGDVKGVQTARDMIAEMRKETEAYNKATSSEEQQEAYNKYSDTRHAFKAQMEYINAAKALSDSQKTEDKKVDPIRQQYQSILDLVNEINSKSSEISKLKKADDGTGMFSAQIEEVKSQKELLVNELQSITQDINNTLSQGFVEGKSYSVPSVSFLKDSGAISSFLSDVQTQASLSKKEIDALIASLQESRNIDIKAVSPFIEQLKSVDETANKLSKLYGTSKQSGTLDRNNESVKALESVYAKITEYRERITSGEQLEPEEFIDLKSLIETFTKYGNTLSEVGEKEARYFANKQKFSDQKLIGDSVNTAEQEAKKVLDIQKQLEDAARKIAENEKLGTPFITKFEQGADGISRLDFSAFDQATSTLRTFQVEMGSVTEGIFHSETTISKSLNNIKSAQKQVESIGSLISRLGASGVDVSEGGATQKVKELLTVYKELQLVLSQGDNADQGMIERLMKSSKLTASEVEKLYKQMLQMQSAIASGEATDLGQGNPTNNVYDQLVESAQKYIGASQGAALEIGRFDEKTKTLEVSLRNANGTVENFKVSMDMSGQIAAQQSGVSKLTSTWDRFKASISKAGKQLVTAFAGYNVFYKAISEVRKGVNYVKEIDLALTELKKVTDETEESYRKFLNTAAGTAGEIGSTVSDFTEATANFARLGSVGRPAPLYSNI